jgi:2-methylcitrate dehydratase PrpD
MNMADMLIHVHPELDALARTNLERRLMECMGVDCAEFNHHPHPHALIVKYDPDTVEGMEILGMVRNVDPAATRVGL